MPLFSMKDRLPELGMLEKLAESLRGAARVEVPVEVHYKDLTFPLYTFSLGSTDPGAAVLGLFGGIHGLERIGTRVVLSYLTTIEELLRWDTMIHALLKRMRFIFMPLVNPVGMYLTRRSNGNRVDLMRNAPINARDPLPFGFLAAGHRISRHLPWYRGDEDEPMEVEAQALCDFVKREAFSAKIAVTMDVHSGFGFVDRLWFPYAKTRDPFPRFAEAWALKKRLDATYPYHPYRLEPQSAQYLTHGDLWDSLFDEHWKMRSDNIYLPLSLEMGSWTWLKKNPLQIFSLMGVFDPMKPHRRTRVLRRHLILFDFLARVILSPKSCLRLSGEETSEMRKAAVAAWYRNSNLYDRQ